MGQERMGEAIRVAVIFGPGSVIQPVWFEWRRRKHRVLATTFRHERRRGAARLLHFTVQGEGGLYELSYDTGTQTWALWGLEVE